MRPTVMSSAVVVFSDAPVAPATTTPEHPRYWLCPTDPRCPDPRYLHDRDGCRIAECPCTGTVR